MALEQSTDKIPIRIIRSKNQLGKFQDDVAARSYRRSATKPSVAVP